MSKDFPIFAQRIRENFDRISARYNELYRSKRTRDDLWSYYLESFPEGTNEVFRERTEHDCSCCRNFIKNVANVVAIKDNQLVSIWDGCEDLPHPYNMVAAGMNTYVKMDGIENIFRCTEHSYGSGVTPQLLDDGKLINWNHFQAPVAREFVTRDVDRILGERASIAGVFQRGLETIRISDLKTIIGLIQDNLLYRGTEFLRPVEEFMKLCKEYQKINDPIARNIFIWENINDPAVRFRNTVIGTLAKDLSENIPMEDAVKMFESKVAPLNYKRPKALITPDMIKKAMKTIQELDLEDALERRFATIEDVSVNDILFVDRGVKSKMKDSLEDVLMGHVKMRPTKKDNATKIGIENFMNNVVTKAIGMDVLLENKHLGNFVSLTAPVHEDVKNLFKWNNNFAWSYEGNVTDSIKERVKAAGGNTDANLRFSLAWFNTDDLDIHVRDPKGNHISFSNKMGKLDVDMNAGVGTRTDPVENVSFPTVWDGTYEISVNQFSRRNNKDGGFDLQVYSDGETQNFHCDVHLTSGKTIVCLIAKVVNGRVTEIKASKELKTGSADSKSQEKWGLESNKFIPVNTLMFSPNFWHGQEIGNKHWFFILKDCENPDDTRGIYNEFLKNELNDHRKVFEILGDKTKCPHTTDQLSGLGFSSTRQDTVIVSVDDGKSNRLYEVSF